LYFSCWEVPSLLGTCHVRGVIPTLKNLAKCCASCQELSFLVIVILFLLSTALVGRIRPCQLVMFLLGCDVLVGK
jgi:hypothetical protein